MSFQSKITCDACGCINSKHLDARDPCDAETEMLDLNGRAGGWLFTVDNYHYCPDHALACGNELGLEYSS